MSRRLTDALAAGRRWLVRHWFIVWPPLAVMLVVGLGAVFIYVVPMQLVHRDNASTPDSLTKARHDERATLLQSLVGLLALFGAVSAFRQLRVTREGQITDRYTKAIDQLDTQKALAVRLGGLYALERIARDSPPDRATIAEVLCAYARTAPREPLTAPAPDSSPEEQLGRVCNVSPITVASAGNSRSLGAAEPARHIEAEDVRRHLAQVGFQRTQALRPERARPVGP
jgi:hypothetical protein